MSQSVSTLASIPSSIASETQLSIEADMISVIRSMSHPESRLKMNSRQEFLGSDLVSWLFSNVEGFASKVDARKYASKLLNAGFIHETLDKGEFYEGTFYVFAGIF